ncbi:MAG: substrate-binding domain-containing protein [Rhodospirillales bacterium]
MAEGEPLFVDAGSNIVLDFHGDPDRARLVVFSDGNHHMALEESVATFVAANPEVEDVFYATTPPGPLLSALKKGVLHLGNLSLSVRPHVFIGPGDILQKMAADGLLESHAAFTESRGNVLLVRKGNPKAIEGVGDLMRGDVSIVISNPQTEKASFQVYCKTLVALAEEAGLNGQKMKSLLAGGGDRVCYSTTIHHREVPQILASGAADVAMVYYHLGLRYSRIFPDVFNFVPLGGTHDNPDPGPGHEITCYHIGMVGDGGEWGRVFADFMAGDAGAIYERHGLRGLS